MLTQNLKLSIIWSSLTIAVFVLFYFLLPVNIYRQGTVLIVLIGSVGFTYTFMKSAIYILRYKEEIIKKIVSKEKTPSDTDLNKKYGRVGWIMAILFFASFFGSIVLFLYSEVQMESNEIDKYGVITKGTVSYGNVLVIRKDDLSTVTVGFKLENGDSSWTTIRINQKSLNNYYKGQEVYLVYSSRYPLISQLFVNIADLNKFELRTNRKITIPLVQ
jgi:uncharacterized membrane protein (DUF485 family)